MSVLLGFTGLPGLGLGMANYETSNEKGIEWDRGNPARRCAATGRSGVRCRNWAIKGGAVCRYHGGSTAHVKAKAKERLEQAADRMAKELLGIAISASSEAVKLAAVKDALDRAGLSAKQSVEVGVDPAPWEGLFESIAGIATVSRADSRSARGLPASATPELPAPPSLALPEVVDAELVPDGPEPAETGFQRPADVRTRPIPPDGPTAAPQTAPGLVSMEEAVTETRVRQVRVTRRYR